MVRKLVVTGMVLAAAACSSPQTPASPPAAEAAAAVQLGGPATGTGALSADANEIQPADPAKFNKVPGYSPYAGRNYPERPLFGDEHVHTGWSADAGGAGTTLEPEEATRFARGEEVTSTSGQPVKLGTPLDWVVITDHSDVMGVDLRDQGWQSGHDGRRHAEALARHDYGGRADAQKATMELIGAQATRSCRHSSQIRNSPGRSGTRTPRSPRNTMSRAASPRSSATSGPRTRAAATTCTATSSIVTARTRRTRCCRMTTFQTENPEDLWKWMAEWEKKTGGKLLAIPHNGNLSNGRMFELTTFDGRPMTRSGPTARAMGALVRSHPDEGPE